MPRGIKNPVTVSAVTGLERIQNAMYIITSTGAFPLPCPPEFGSAPAVVVIPPKGSVSRRTRKSINRHKFAYFIIEADPFDENRSGARPQDFNFPTLKWAMQLATLVVLWGGHVPFNPDRFTETLKSHIRRGGRIVIALIRDANHDEWVRFAYEQSQGRAELFGIKGIPGVSVGSKRCIRAIGGTIH
jgi:hypothetical protein